MAFLAFLLWSTISRSWVNADTWIFTKFVDQHIVSRQWWVFLVDCDYTEINESIDTNIQYKLHFTQDSDSYVYINNMHDQVTYKELSANDSKQPKFRIITFVISCVFVLMQCCWFCSSYVVKRKKITIQLNDIIQKVQRKVQKTTETDYNYESERKVLAMLTLVIVLFAFEDLFMIIFWFKLAIVGHRMFVIYLFGILFESISGMIFYWLFLRLFSVENNKMFRFIQYVLILVIAIFEFTSNIYWYNHYDLGQEGN
eukprot:531711_1